MLPNYVAVKVLGGLPVEVAVHSEASDAENGISEKLVSEWEIVRVGESQNASLCAAITKKIVEEGYEEVFESDLEEAIRQLIWDSQEP